MEFRPMATEMSDKEVSVVLRLIEPFSKVDEIIRNLESNSLMVRYSLLKEEYRQIHQINFLPDDIYLLADSTLEETQMEEGEILYQYRQFMIAKGYSEMWLNNPYVEL